MGVIAGCIQSLIIYTSHCDSINELVRSELISRVFIFSYFALVLGLVNRGMLVGGMLVLLMQKLFASAFDRNGIVVVHLIIKMVQIFPCTILLSLDITDACYRTWSHSHIFVDINHRISKELERGNESSNLVVRYLVGPCLRHPC